MILLIKGIEYSLITLFSLIIILIFNNDWLINSMYIGFAAFSIFVTIYMSNFPIFYIEVVAVIYCIIAVLAIMTKYKD